MSMKLCLVILRIRSITKGTIDAECTLDHNEFLSPFDQGAPLLGSDHGLAHFK